MAWNLDSDRPIYAQLLERIQRQIVSGRYRPGDKLPSVRELAAEASVNPNTMQKAFAELERSGLIITRRTSGRFVTEDTQMIAQIRTSLAKEEILSFLARMKGLGFETQDIIRILSQEEIPSETERSAQA
ncbi:MAG TPA: GntR family transcriptional regulator [Candidatus Eisenbergiella stercorigallinarum]|uniref:GntR family transcriptional regulator n=1 Tax=Candidatus Eisenbergiella stercorigallinarum TaxID=2838557 RepID=A0A9D2QZV9_9FIRM|nr:GntR family transcriptional regulator [Candidatus Eisenbergiella stercorigallinarum]